jgi:hypothetical protein
MADIMPPPAQPMVAEWQDFQQRASRGLYVGAQIVEHQPELVLCPVVVVAPAVLVHVALKPC